MGLTGRHSHAACCLQLVQLSQSKCSQSPQNWMVICIVADLQHAKSKHCTTHAAGKRLLSQARHSQAHARTVLLQMYSPCTAGTPAGTSAVVSTAGSAWRWHQLAGGHRDALGSVKIRAALCFLLQGNDACHVQHAGCRAAACSRDNGLQGIRQSTYDTCQAKPACVRSKGDGNARHPPCLAQPLATAQ
jgi:hypothetical protein